MGTGRSPAQGPPENASLSRLHNCKGVLFPGAFRSKDIVLRLGAAISISLEKSRGSSPLLSARAGGRRGRRLPPDSGPSETPRAPEPAHVTARERGAPALQRTPPRSQIKKGTAFAGGKGSHRLLEHLPLLSRKHMCSPTSWKRSTLSMHDF